MKKKLLLILAIAGTALAVKAQDTIKVTADAPLVLTGSVDAYYKYDFAKVPNIQTSFGSDQNSFSLGMVDLGLKKKTGAASFVGEISFGPRSNGSIGGGVNTDYHIQNLYISYDLTSKLNVTGGYMSTFVGYEVISPTGNFNYSTSYLFTNGPFQNAGLKFTYAFSDKVSLMAGIFNNLWNYYSANTLATGDVSTFGAQLTVTPVKNWTAYVNLVSGYASGTEWDLTTSYQITPAFKLGLNAADFSVPTWKSGPMATVLGGTSGGFDGIAVYPQLAVSKTVTVGLREEYFTAKTGSKGTAASFSNVAAGSSVTATTLSLNVKSGNLTFIPEFRFDNGSSSTQFVDGNGKSTGSASQISFAAVYAF